MEAIREMQLGTQVAGVGTPEGTSSEWGAAALRPVAHWVRMPGADGRGRLSMVWEVPDPIPPAVPA